MEHRPKGVKLDVKEIAPKGYCRSCKQRMKMDEISCRNEVIAYIVFREENMKLTKKENEK